MVNWSTHTKHNLPFICNSKAKDKTKVSKVPIDEGKGTQGRKASITNG